MIDINKAEFPIRDQLVYLAHCGISPLYFPAAEAMKKLIDFHAKNGDQLFRDFYFQELERFGELTGRLLRTAPENIAVTKNTTEALSMIANGYPFEEWDEVILYEHEYPANFYPWVNLKRKGVVIRTLPNLPDDRLPSGTPGSWSMDTLESLVTSRTKMIVMSHVQFVTGYAADLRVLSDFCRERGIDLVIDAAQSLGALPIDLEETPISALAASGWKWIMGPVAVSPFYTSPAMREKIELTMVGAETMVQGAEFLDHTWAPHDTARRYEYSTSPVYQVHGFNQCLESIYSHRSPKEIFQRLLFLQDLFLENLDHPDFVPMLWPGEHRSGILSFYHPRADEVREYLRSQGIVVTARSGFIRLAPHFYNTEEEIRKAATAVNAFP